MMKIQTFKNNSFGEIRTVRKNEEIFFIGQDVAKGLGYKNTRDALKRHVDIDDKAEVAFHDGRQNRTAIGINESGLYSLILSSELPNAKEYKRWVTREVLPSIRKHGAYLTDAKIEEVLTDPDTLIKLATQLKMEREEKLALKLENETNRPKVLFAEAVENSDDVILVKEMAIILTQQGFSIGQNQLFQYLREYNFLCKKYGDMYHLPTKKHEHLFKVTKRTIQNSNTTQIKNTPKINGKGQMYFIKKFSEYKELGLTVKELLTKKEVM